MADEERKAGGRSPLSLRYSIERELNEGDFELVLCAAIEGGIGYWACLDNTTTAWKRARAELKKERGKNPTLDEIATRVLRNGDAVLLCDAEAEEETPEELEWRLTAPNLTEALWKFRAMKEAESAKRNGPTGFYDLKRALEEGEFDADDADWVIQNALFGEVVYG